MKKILLITMLLCSTGIADDTPADNHATPLDVIADCVDAVQQRDFRRYVDHLSHDEQKLQSGVILFIQSSGMLSLNSGDAGNTLPGDRLLLYVLNDLRKKHTAADWGPEQTAANQAVAALYGEANNGAIQQVGAPYVGQGVSYPTSGRELCIQSAATMKDPAAFLVEALEEVFRSTVVTGKPPNKNVDTLSMTDVIEDVCKPYEELEFTLYTRGDYAIAVAELPAPVAPPAQSPAPAQPLSPAPAPPLSPTNAPEAAVPAPVAPGSPSFASTDPYGQPYYGPAYPSAQPPIAASCENGLCPVPGSDANETTNEVTVLFRRIDGQWKITELFPIKQMF